ncbi:hypothetical protein [Sphingomonas sp.]|uniref:hypothetical protein n=1 Tax=Sphingomonas sp. TaxID=28214 RepID=UPI0035A883DD
MLHKDSMIEAVDEINSRAGFIVDRLNYSTSLLEAAKTGPEKVILEAIALGYDAELNLLQQRAGLISALNEIWSWLDKSATGEVNK